WQYVKSFRFDSDIKDDLLTIVNNKWYIQKAKTTQTQTVTFNYLGQNYQVTIPGGPGFDGFDTQIPIPSGYASAKLMDVDGDGRKDLVYVNNSNTYVRFLGPSNFGAEQATNV